MNDYDHECNYCGKKFYNLNKIFYMDSPMYTCPYCNSRDIKDLQKRYIKPDVYGYNYREDKETYDVFGYDWKPKK